MYSKRTLTGVAMLQFWIRIGLSLLVCGAAQVRAEPSYVGSSSCASCHAKEHADWEGSHHQQAMAEASPQTVLGNFNNTSFSYNGVTTTFQMRGNDYFVTTDGPDGSRVEYKIAYTFGVYPLQQYLVKFPQGKLQALSISWDSRPAKDGGQRWFHLYQHEKVDHSDVLHWTKLSQNWNYMCAECHSTNLQKNYDPQSQSFHTTWSEISVGCEACHGPASDHVTWAHTAESERSSSDNGLTFGTKRLPFIARHDPKNGATLPASDRPHSDDVAACGRCHSRRSGISPEYTYGHPLTETHLPALLTSGLYHADGQIQDEVYEYGSFTQSKMYQSGVGCSDCHNPHTLKLRAPGNQVCAQCHQSTKYDAPTHHFHKVGSAGAECKSCHMPTKQYMQIDSRFDHSMRIPAPARSAEIGAPDACTSCHQGKSAQWAENEIRSRFGPAKPDFHDFGRTFARARTGDPAAAPELLSVLADDSAPAIVRATAAHEMGRFLNPATVGLVARELYDESPEVRAAALGALETVPEGIKTQLLPRLLSDKILGVRIEAARVLASVPRSKLSPENQRLFDSARAEYERSQRMNAESPQAQLNLGIFYAVQREYDRAEESYRTAMKLEPQFVPAYVNLADLYRQTGRDQAGLKELQAAIKQVPNNAEAHYALGLLQIRMKQKGDALHSLKTAAELQPENLNFSYVYLVALKDLGEKATAQAFLATVKTRFPHSAELKGLEDALK